MSEETVELVRRAYDEFNRERAAPLAVMDPRVEWHTAREQNVEVVRRAFAAFEDGDLDRLRDLVTDDLIVYRAEPDGATSRGLDGFLRLTAEWTEGFRDWVPAPQEFIDAGQQVMVRVSQSARGEASGVPVVDDFWFVFELRASRIARMSIYAHEREALEATGLSEESMSRESD